MIEFVIVGGLLKHPRHLDFPYVLCLKPLFLILNLFLLLTSESIRHSLARLFLELSGFWGVD
jgi:hypothetical protein